MVNKVLIVDDEPLIREFLKETLERLDCEVEYVDNGLKAIELFKKGSDFYDLVFLDMKLPGANGIEVLREIKSQSEQTDVVVITAYGTIENAVEAMKLGAFDYLLKPFTPEQVELVVNKLNEKQILVEENRYLKNEIEKEYNFSEIIGESEKMKEVYSIIQRVAKTPSTVLITGESGTGKELVARAITSNSLRKGKPFIKVNCAALPETLLESELFGHEKGAFTGAIQRRKGRFELAHKGTILLDEIGEIPPKIQAKLLRVLQEKEFERVGGDKPIKVDVRVIATTNRDLEKEIKEGRFREDLYYRLNVIPIKLAPLRERKEDIPLLVKHFLKKYNTYGKESDFEVSAKAMEIFMKYDWPGNVRELENIIERIVVLGLKDRELESHLESVLLNKKSNEDDIFRVGRKMADVEKDYILKTLEYMSNNKTKTAEVLDISIRTLRNKLNSYGIK